MELRRYLAIVKKHWLLAGTTFAVTILATLYFVMPQPWIYESTGTVRVRPSGTLLDQEDVIDAYALLSEPKIPNTFAAVISSDAVVELAKLRLPADADTAGLKIDTQVVIDTPIIDLTVAGQDATTVQQMATAVMTEARRYVNGSGDSIFEIEIIEGASLPGGPVSPNKNLQLILGGVFGALLAIAVALFAEYIRKPVEDFAITDVVTGASNELYLRHRLREETARTVRTGEPFTVATLRVEVRTGENDDMAHVPADRDLRRIARGLRLTIPDDAVLAYLGGGLFAALVPGIAAAQIENTVGGWSAAVGALLDWSSQGELSRRLQLTTGLCEFRGTSTTGSEQVERLVSKLIGEVNMEDLVSEPAAKRSGNGTKPPAATEEAKERPAEPPAPAMPPAPVSTVKKQGNGGNGGNGRKTSAAPKKQVRRVTVLPDIDDMPPIEESKETTGTSATTSSQPKGAGREKGDAGDPAR